MNIFLVGLSGTGKSSIGKQLASRLNYTFRDSDSEVSERIGLPIGQIFSEHGESYFRNLEKEWLYDLLETNKKNQVIATGAGLPCNHNLMEVLTENGVVLHFYLSFNTLISRLKASYERPLLSSNIETTITTQWKERKAIYEKSDLTVDTMNWNAKKMDDLLRALGQINAI